MNLLADSSTRLSLTRTCRILLSVLVFAFSCSASAEALKCTSTEGMTPSFGAQCGLVEVVLPTDYATAPMAFYAAARMDAPALATQTDGVTLAQIERATPQPAATAPSSQIAGPMTVAGPEPCVTLKMLEWLKPLVRTHSQPDNVEVNRKANEFRAICRRESAAGTGSIKPDNALESCESDTEANAAALTQPASSKSTPSTTAERPVNPARDIDTIAQACQSRNASNGAVINWLRVHLRGGRYGDLPDLMFDELRPGDGHIVIYGTPLSKPTPGAEVEIEEQMRLRLLVRPQGEAPDSLFALRHQRGNGYKLLPLNYSANNPLRIEMPWNPAQLSAVYDQAQDKYLLYADSVEFLTPAWDTSSPSWQAFYVWWFDAKRDSIKRVLLPPGPWVDDAKLDGPLLRGMQNFSCGTGCYRHYEITASSGAIYVTIAGRTSAVSAAVTGTYRFDAGSAGWVKL
jgi:hypothetical protein